MPLASADRDAQPVRQWVRTGENLGPFSHAVVGPSPFLAISKRAGGFSLVNPQDLTRKMVARDLELVHQIHASVAIREILLAGYLQATGHDDTAWRRRQRSEADRFPGATAGCGFNSRKFGSPCSSGLTRVRSESLVPEHAVHAVPTSNEGRQHSGQLEADAHDRRRSQAARGVACESIRF
jgi:hypothetical protein